MFVTYQITIQTSTCIVNFGCDQRENFSLHSKSSFNNELEIIRLHYLKLSYGTVECEKSAGEFSFIYISTLFKYRSSRVSWSAFINKKVNISSTILPSSLTLHVQHTWPFSTFIFIAPLILLCFIRVLALVDEVKRISERRTLSIRCNDSHVCAPSAGYFSCRALTSTSTTNGGIFLAFHSHRFIGSFLLFTRDSEREKPDHRIETKIRTKLPECKAHSQQLLSWIFQLALFYASRREWKLEIDNFFMMSAREFIS